MATCSVCGRKMSGFSFGKPKCAWCLRHEAAQRGELPDDAPLPVMPVPWARTGLGSASLTHALVGINVVIFAAMVVNGIPMMDPPAQLLIPWGANYGPLTASGQWWRLITYNFLHSGLLHIGFNMWCLWDLGALAESLYGTWTFGAIYMVSGVAGGLLSVAWEPNRLSVGASGAIFGLAGALIAGYYLGEFSIPRPMIQMQLRSLLVFVGFNVVFGAVSGRTDNAAHFGGLLTGLLCGALVARLAPSSEEMSSRVAIIAVMVLALGGGIFGLTRARGYMIHVRQGEQLLGQQQNDAAIAEFQSAIRLKPDNVPARLDLANAYYTSRQFPQAEAELKRVLALEPNNDEAAGFMGFVYLAQNRAPEAEKIFSKLLAKNYSLSEAHYGLGRALAEQGRDEDAIKEYKTTISMSPGFQSVYYRLGVSELKLKQYDDAIAALERDLREGEDYDTEVALAQAYQAKGQPDKAAEAMQRAEKVKGSER
jgi:membrane associated rhomboid family serine protease/Flp pilus assembly protein TadD